MRDAGLTITPTYHSHGFFLTEVICNVIMKAFDWLQNSWAPWYPSLNNSASNLSWTVKTSWELQLVEATKKFPGICLGAERRSQSKGKAEDSVTHGEHQREGCWAEVRGDETNPGNTVHQGNETHFCCRAINSSINILTNSIKGFATLGISASSLPSPDSNRFSAYIKLSNKKSITANFL